MDVSILVKGLESQLGGVLASHVIEVRPEQLLNVLSVDNQQLPR